jgi:phosphate ABC transporter phosphate-binding protein
MSVWSFGYTQIQPNIQVNYQSVGSGAGIAQITAGTVEFGASDAPLTAAQYAALPAGSTLLTIPEAVGSEVPAYNLPGVTTSLHFTGNVLAEIFLGTITMWNDPAIVALNPGVTLPAHAITVVHRSDGSGTTFVWTQYLSDSNPTWAKQVGFATTVNWPTGLGGKGNVGVAGVIENTQYSLGYLELSYVLSNPTLITAGQVQNAAGNFISANQTSVQAALAAGSGSLPAGNVPWTTVSIVNAIYNDTAATKAYPITSFTYVLVYQQQTNKQTATDLANFIYWVVNDAQSAGLNIGYVSLPASVVTLDDTTLGTITYNGTPVL